jgi:hypothetical protein
MPRFATEYYRPLINPPSGRRDPFSHQEIRCLRHRMESLAGKLSPSYEVGLWMKWVVYHNGKEYQMRLIVELDCKLSEQSTQMMSDFIKRQTSHTGPYLARDQWYPVKTKHNNVVGSYVDHPIEGLLYGCCTENDNVLYNEYRNHVRS